MLLHALIHLSSMTPAPLLCLPCPCSEETTCRFCAASLPDWKASLLGPEEEDGPPREPLIAAVVWQNTVYKIEIKPGPEGKAEFKRTVNRLFGLSLGSRYECTFECKLKGGGDEGLVAKCLDRTRALLAPQLPWPQKDAGAGVEVEAPSTN